MADDRDRLGETLRNKQKGEEDRFFAERDKAALEKLRQQKSAAELEQIRELARMRCPKCGDQLTTLDHHGVAVDECPSCRGMWLDEGELETLAARDKDSRLGRLFYRPNR